MEYNITIKSLTTGKEYTAVVYEKEKDGIAAHIIKHASLKEIYYYQMAEEDRPSCEFWMVDLSRMAPHAPIACAASCRIGNVEEIGEMTFTEFNGYQTSCVNRGVTISPLQTVRNRAFDKAFINYMKFQLKMENQIIQSEIYGSSEFSQNLVLVGRDLSEQTAVQHVPAQTQTLIQPDPKQVQTPVQPDPRQVQTPVQPDPRQVQTPVQPDPRQVQTPVQPDPRQVQTPVQPDPRQVQTPVQPENKLLDPVIHRITYDQARNVTHIQTNEGNISLHRDPIGWVSGTLKANQLNLRNFYKKCSDYLGMQLIDFVG